MENQLDHEQSYETPYNQDEPTECETWISCAGHLHYLKTKFRTSEAILNEIESNENVHEEYFFIQMKELAEQVNKSSKQLLKASTKVLEKLESSKGSLDNNSQDSTLPLLDPGEKSTNLEHSCKASPTISELFNVLERQHETHVFPARLNKGSGSRKCPESTQSVENAMHCSSRVYQVGVEQLRSNLG